jgi:hypothetical protein
MTTLTLFKEYNWLIDTIHRARYISLRELNEQWVETEMSGGVEMSRMTFFRHKCDIEEMFGVQIDFDRKRGKYFIGNAEVLSRDSVQNWMLSTLSVSNLLGESKALQDRILLEHVPSVVGRMEPIITAMRKSVKLRMAYRKYDNGVAKEYLVAPYCIKLYRQRWYMLALYDEDRLHVFAFDRIEQVVVTQECFVIDPDFDAQAYYADCMGVTKIESVKPQRVVLRAFGNECDYVRSLPVHASQRELGSGDGYTDFEYYVRPTLELCGHILSRGARMKVILPQSLADQVHQMLQDALNHYNM